MLYFFQILNSEKDGIAHNHIQPSGWNLCAWTDWSPHARPLGSLWGSFLFNLQTHGPHKCFSHCPLQSIKEILPFVSTISGILLVLYELCPPICAFQCSHLCDLCRKECCLQWGRRLIQSNPPCDFIMQGTKPIVLLSTNESSSYYFSLLLLWPANHMCERLKRQNAVRKKKKSSNLNASPRNHSIYTIKQWQNWHIVHKCHPVQSCM